MTEIRACSGCGQCLPKDSKHFKPLKKSKDGLSTECRACTNKRSIAWQKTEKGIAARKRYEAKSKEKRSAYIKKYQAENRGKISAYVQSWREKNREHCRKIDTEWARRNKAKRTEYRHKRRTTGEFSYSVVEELKLLQRSKCAVCRGFLTSLVEVDHIFPIALGGTNERSNLQLLCRPCNRSKGAKHPIDFMQKRGFLL